MEVWTVHHFPSLTGFVSNPILPRNHTYYGFKNYTDRTWLQASIPPVPSFYLSPTLSYTSSSQIYFQTLLFKGGQSWGTCIWKDKFWGSLLLFIMGTAQIKHRSPGRKQTTLSAMPSCWLHFLLVFLVLKIKPRPLSTLDKHQHLAAPLISSLLSLLKNLLSGRALT